MAQRSRPTTALLGAAAAVVVLGATVMAAGVADTGNAFCTLTPPDPDRADQLTAALVDPPPASVPEDVDAQGCDIGIYFGPSRTGGVVVGAHVHGAKRYGVLVEGPGPGIGIDQASIFDIGDTPFSGVQQGVGAAYLDGASGFINRTQIYAYQKNGVLADGAGTDLDVLRSIVRGRGPLNVPQPAQNGIQFSNLATGRVTENVILDHEYAPDPVVAIGLLIFAADPADVERHLNEYRDNEFNVYVCPAQNGFCSPM